MSTTREVDWHGNRFNEEYTFVRVAWDTWQEHESYDYITDGSIEYSEDAELKVTGSFSFEGYEFPNIDDLFRVYYSFSDDYGESDKVPLATLFVSYASLQYVDAIDGLKASGSLDGVSVLTVLQEKLTGTPYTIPEGSSPIYEAQRIIRSCGLNVNYTPSSVAMTSDHTFDAGTDYLTIVNWLCDTAAYAHAYPDAEGTVNLTPYIETQGNFSDLRRLVFENNDRSIMYPEIEEKNEFNSVPNVVALLYNTDTECYAAQARNIRGSRASLEARGGREKTYFEEVSDAYSVESLERQAEETLRAKSCDTEYVTISHAYVPVMIHDNVTINYSELSWDGTADNVSIELSPGTKTQTRIKRTLYANIEVETDSVPYRSGGDDE